MIMNKIVFIFRLTINLYIRHFIYKLVQGNSRSSVHVVRISRRNITDNRFNNFLNMCLFHYSSIVQILSDTNKLFILRFILILHSFKSILTDYCFTIKDSLFHESNTNNSNQIATNTNSSYPFTLLPISKTIF